MRTLAITLTLLAAACSTTKPKVWTYSSGAATYTCDGQTTTDSPTTGTLTGFSASGASSGDDGFTLTTAAGTTTCSFSPAEEGQLADVSCETPRGSFSNFNGGFAVASQQTITIAFTASSTDDMNPACTVMFNLVFTET